MGAWGLLGQALLQALLIFAVFVSIYDIAARAFRIDGLLAFCAAVLLLGVLGYLMFWLAWLNYRVFSIVKIALLTALLVHFAVVVFRRRIAAHLAAIDEPLCYAFLFSVVVLGIGYANGGIDGLDDTARVRFTVRLPGDNVIPLVVANALKWPGIASPLFGDWLSSDRPPLQTGLYLLLTTRTNTVNYYIVAMWLQATVLFGVWGLAVAAGLTTPARRLLLLACCLLPTTLLNTIFPWPKLLSAGYLLLALSLLFGPRPLDGSRVTRGILIGGLAALAMLSHGTAAFALIGFAVTVVVFWVWPPLKTMIYGAAALLLLYVPWTLYQRFIDPPGNRLLKWHLAGVIDVDARGFLTTLRDSYGTLTWHDYIAGRSANVGALIGNWPVSLVDAMRVVLGGDANLALAVRMEDFFYFLPSLHVFSLAVIVAIAVLPFWRTDQSPQRDLVLRMLVALLATLAAVVILIFIPGQAINHQSTYLAQLLATVFAFAVLLPRAQWLAVTFVIAQAVTVTAAYAVTLKYDPAYWPLLVVAIGASLALVGYSFAPFVRRTV